MIKPDLESHQAEFEKNTKGMFGQQVKFFESELHLLDQFVKDLAVIDPDLLIGHEINSSLELLIDRIHENKLPLLSELSRLRREEGHMRTHLKSYS